MPYDDVNNQYFIGGKLAWHLTDSFGWEILDAQKASASITSWANNLVNDKNITNLQTAQLDYVATTNLLFLPFTEKFESLVLLWFTLIFIPLWELDWREQKR